MVYTKYMSYTELLNNFAIGEDVFYPSIGLCSILKKEERNGKEYLKLSSLSTDSIVLLPVENAINLGLRHLTPKSEMVSCIKGLANIEKEEKTEWKHRVERNTALIKEGKASSLCRVISSLYSRSLKKALPSVEKKLYDKALIMLVDEASSVLKKSEEEVRKIVFSYLKSGVQL